MVFKAIIKWVLDQSLLELAPESQKHSDKKSNQFDDQREPSHRNVRQAQHRQNSLTPVLDRSLNNRLFHKDTNALAQNRNMQNPRIAPSELPASSHAAEQPNSGAELSTVHLRTENSQ